MDLDLYNRYNLSKFGRSQFHSYVDENAELDFQNYLDLWSINPKFKIISVEDDQATYSKLNSLKFAQFLSKAGAFSLMTFLYYYTNGFKTTLPWYYKYPRHIICIGIGTVILPKYLIGERFSDYFKYFEDQQNKYKKHIAENKEGLQSQIANYQNTEYLIKLAHDVTAQNLQKTPQEDNQISQEVKNLESDLKIKDRK